MSLYLLFASLIFLLFFCGAVRTRQGGFVLLFREQYSTTRTEFIALITGIILMFVHQLKRY